MVSMLVSVLRRSQYRLLKASGSVRMPADRDTAGLLLPQWKKMWAVTSHISLIVCWSTTPLIQ